jgi:hypothetical protein
LFEKEMMALVTPESILSKVIASMSPLQKGYVTLSEAKGLLINND